MESNRGLSLLRQAHCEGRIDLRDAEPLDSRWWKKVLWTLDWVDRENQNRISDLKHRLHCSLLNYLSGEKAVSLHWDQATEHIRRIIRNLFPYLKGGTRREEIESMANQWKQIWGDPRDPKVAAEIQRTVEHLLSMGPKRRQCKP